MGRYSRKSRISNKRYRAINQSSMNNLQTRLKVGTPGDRYEKEADEVAEKVVSQNKGINSTSFSSETQVQAQFLKTQSGLAQTMGEKEEETAQAKFIQKQGQQEEDKLQKQTEKEEEPVQTSFLQKQAEEEEAQTSLIQKQEEKEEEPQAKFIQNKEENSMVQKMEEEEEAQTKQEKNSVSNFVQCMTASVMLKASPKQSSSKHKRGASESTEKESGAKFNFSSLLDKTKAGGRPLDNNTRDFMGQKLGYNFSGVRIHTGADAETLCRHLNAQAFTVGNHIYFNIGKYRPDTDVGLKLLAHELVHVIQQGK